MIFQFRKMKLFELTVNPPKAKKSLFALSTNPERPRRLDIDRYSPRTSLCI